MLKFQKKLTSSCAHKKKRDVGQNPGATKIPLPLWAWDKKSLAHPHAARNVVLN